MPKSVAPLVCLVLEHAPDGPAEPVLQARLRPGPLLLQAAADLRQRAPLQAHPAEHLLDDRGLLGVDLPPRLAASLGLVDVTVAVRGPADGADPAGVGRMELPATDPFEDLGTLVLGHHPLHLQQQMVFGGLADLVIEEGQFHTAPPQLVHQEHLVNIRARHAIGRVDIESVESSGRRLVAEPLQRGADQRGAAVTIVDEAKFGIEFQAVVLDPLGEGLKLAGDRVALDLPVGRDAGIDGRPDFMVAH